MSYIWGFSTAPDYLTAARTVENISSELATAINYGNTVDEKQIIWVMHSIKKKPTYRESIYKWDILSNTCGVPLVNKKVLNMLERECAGKFQAIPAILKLPDGDEVTEYYVINVTHKVPIASLEDCIKKDEYKDDNKIRGFIFSRQAYKSSIVEAEDLCRDSIICGNLIFISECLRKVFRKEKIKGGGFHTSLRDRVVFV